MKELNKLEKQKIENDPFYSKLYEKHGLEFIINAGFIFDNAPYVMKITDDFDCTPVSFLIEKLKTSKNPAIIYSTGSFCPVHDGHLEMMGKAKEAVEAAGYDVIGGYLAPDNDEYVSRKVNVLNIHERLRIISKQIRDIDWLAIDPWNGVFRNYAENFTSLIVHLKKYIKRHLGKDIPIFYVCGGDNAKFCMTFVNEGHCVVVDRPGTFAQNNYSDVFNERILYVFNDNPNSSTEVRKTFKKQNNDKRILLLRSTGYDPRELLIIEELKKHFDIIKRSESSNEIKIFKGLGVEMISLDSVLKTNYNLEISRQYDYYGQKFMGWVPRPGCDSLEVQLEKIPNGNYFLFDDDIHTGRTISHVKKLFEGKATILGQISLTTSNDSEEVLDIRDFYYKTENSGLVILNSDGQKERMPYIYPTVCPYQRASIMQPLEFSLNIWKINYAYFIMNNMTKEAQECDLIIEKLKNIR